MNDLISFLAAGAADGTWRGWQITRIHGGVNNILYRVTGDGQDWAVKFTIRDERKRAWREFQALTAIQEAGLSLAPQPILLDETSYAQPVVVQTWVAGEVTAVPPQTDDDWTNLLAHYAALTAVTPRATQTPLREGVINFSSVENGILHIHQQMQRLPATNQPQVLRQFVGTMENKLLPNAPTFPQVRALCRVDANTRNFIRRDDQWLSVDWENSGWGDPAFEIVDLMTHPAYLDVSQQRWEWVIEKYGEMVMDETAVTRIQTYYPLMLVWWVARWARFLYEVPRGKDERLIQRPANWLAETEQKMARYVERITAVCDQW